MTDCLFQARLDARRKKREAAEKARLEKSFLLDEESDRKQEVMDGAKEDAIRGEEAKSYHSVAGKHIINYKWSPPLQPCPPQTPPPALRAPTSPVHPRSL